MGGASHRPSPYYSEGLYSEADFLIHLNHLHTWDFLKEWWTWMSPIYIGKALLSSRLCGPPLVHLNRLNTRELYMSINFRSKLNLLDRWIDRVPFRMDYWPWNFWGPNREDRNHDWDWFFCREEDPMEFLKSTHPQVGPTTHLILPYLKLKLKLRRATPFIYMSKALLSSSLWSNLVSSCLWAQSLVNPNEPNIWPL